LSLLHDTVWSQFDWLNRAEVHQRQLLVGCTVPWPLGTCGTQGAVVEELRTRMPHQAVSLQVKISLDVERFHKDLIVGVTQQNIISDITYDINMISYHMKHLYLRILSQIAVACQVDSVSLSGSW
jgi:hypothetical protein